MSKREKNVTVPLSVISVKKFRTNILATCLRKHYAYDYVNSLAMHVVS